MENKKAYVTASVNVIVLSVKSVLVASPLGSDNDGEWMWEGVK